MMDIGAVKLTDEQFEALARMMESAADMVVTSKLGLSHRDYGSALRAYEGHKRKAKDLLVETPEV